MHRNNSFQWSKFIDQAMKIYLNRKHRTIGMSPLEAEKDENQLKVRRRFFEKYVKAGGKRRKPKFSFVDSVRVRV